MEPQAFSTSVVSTPSTLAANGGPVDGATVAVASAVSAPAAGASLDPLKSARILIVDDEPANVLLLQTVLEDAGYDNMRSTTDSRSVQSLHAGFDPDIILLDLMMPDMDGYEVMAQLRPSQAANDFLPIIVLTADTSPQTKRRALEVGATDFLTKPFDAIELTLRLQNLLSRRLLHRRLQNQNEVLEERVQERTRMLESSEHETAECLALAGEFRDDDTGQHTQRVGVTASLLARHAGLPGNLAQLMLQAAPLHDIGKIGVPDSILLKPSKLTTEEFQVIKTHCDMGRHILSRHHTPLLQLAATIAVSHHERWDGGGYPAGLTGEDIPVAGRIVAIADVFDALTHERPYKAAWTNEAALEEIQAHAGRQFDPHLVELFSRYLTDILSAQQEYLANSTVRGGGNPVQ